MKEDSKYRLYGIVGTLLFHTLIIIILLLITFNRPPKPADDGGGILVQLGTVDEASGIFEPVKAEENIPEEASPEITEPDNETITQDVEETVNINTPKEEKKKTPEKKQNTKKNTEQPTKEPVRDTRLDKMASLFSNNSNNTGSRGTAEKGTGIQGSPTGNSNTGALTGVGGYGAYNLGGRGITGTLPRPGYDNSNDEGTIVISIVVNPAGKVISASVTPKGSTGDAASNPTLRERALNAAKKATFESVSRTGNQTGTIIYHFKQN